MVWMGKEKYTYSPRVIVDMIFPRIEAQWITAKKDWREAKKRHKMQHNAEPNVSTAPIRENTPPEESQGYEKAMDQMRCILYLHGGECSRNFCPFSVIG